MSELKLQPDELELLASYEQNEWQSAKNVKKQKEQYRTYARAMFCALFYSALTFLP